MATLAEVERVMRELDDIKELARAVATAAKANGYTPGIMTAPLEALCAAVGMPLRVVAHCDVCDSTAAVKPRAVYANNEVPALPDVAINGKAPTIPVVIRHTCDQCWRAEQDAQHKKAEDAAK